MQNPLEKFLLNLAEKIQTEKEYKDIVKNSQSVDVNKDVFAGFIEGISKTIRENVKVSSLSATDNQPSEPDPLDKFLGTLKDKLKDAPVKKVETEVPTVSSVPIDPIQEPEQKNEKDAFEGFVTNLADIIKKEKTKPKKKTVKVVTDEDNEEKKTELKPADEPVDDYVKILSTDKKKDKNKEEDEEDDSLKSFVSSYVNKELANFQKEMAEKMEELKDAVEREMMDDGAGDGGGGGTNSYDYYPGGGPMNGNLSFPVSGTGIIFANGQLLSSYPSGGGGGGGDPAVNSVVYSNSAYWNNAYTNLVNNSANYLTGTAVNLGDIPVLSANWNASYTNLIYNSAAYLSGTDLGLIPILSANWNNTYTQYSTYSASYARTDQNVTFQNNVTILGNLTAKGTATFANTIFTTTSALSVINTGPGPALYVFQASGPYDVASFYDGDGVEVLHVGNANPGGLGYVGINESFPGAELTVQGDISASRSITVAGGNSNQWNSNWSITNTNSGKWESNYTSFNTNSAKYDSVYTTTNSNSATWSNFYTVTAQNFIISGPSAWSVNTTSNTVSGTLPPSPSLGTTIKFLDGNKTWATNNFTILRNGQTIESLAEHLICDISGYSFSLTYLGGSVGWKLY